MSVIIASITESQIDNLAWLLNISIHQMLIDTGNAFVKHVQSTEPEP